MILGIKNGEKCKLQYPQVTEPHEKIFLNGGDFICQFLDGPSFVSSNLFKRELWQKGSVNVKQDCDGYVWLSMLLFGCLDYKCVYFAQPLLYQSFPSIVPYSKRFPLYHIKGLGRLFRYLDANVSGLYEIWVKHFQYERERQTFYILADVANSKVLYKNNYFAIVEHFKRKRFVLFYRFCVYICPSWFANKIIKRIIKAFGIFEYIK